jgi:hypothetical protein
MPNVRPMRDVKKIWDLYKVYLYSHQNIVPVKSVYAFNVVMLEEVLKGTQVVVWLTCFDPTNTVYWWESIYIIQRCTFFLLAWSVQCFGCFTRPNRSFTPHGERLSGIVHLCHRKCLWPYYKPESICLFVFTYVIQDIINKHHNFCMLFLFCRLKELKSHAQVAHPNSSTEELDKILSYKHKAQGKLGNPLDYSKTPCYNYPEMKATLIIRLLSICPILQFFTVFNPNQKRLFHC